MTDEVPAGEYPTLEFIGEDDLHTYEGWVRYQGFDLSVLTGEQAAVIREMFDEAVKRRETGRKVGRMNLKRPGDSVYAVAVSEGANLWLALWVKRSAKGEFFIFHPTAEGDWNPHSSLHLDGTFHMKSHDKKMLTFQRQRPDAINGSEHLGAYAGYAPKTIGAVCDPADFTGVIEAPAGILGPRNGTVTVDLLEMSDAMPLSHPGDEVARGLFVDVMPHVLIRIFR